MDCIIAVAEKPSIADAIAKALVHPDAREKGKPLPESPFYLVLKGQVSVVDDEEGDEEAFPLLATSVGKTFVGTPCYLAPEIEAIHQGGADAPRSYGVAVDACTRGGASLASLLRDGGDGTGLAAVRFAKAVSYTHLRAHEA